MQGAVCPQIFGKIGSRRMALVGLFAAISIILDSLVTPGFSSGVWYGWVFVMSPINGMILGPKDGFLTTLLSVLLGHTLVFRDSIYEFVFTLGAPIGALIAGLVYRGERLKILAYYSFFLGSYFMSPVSRGLPIWGMWDVYVAFIFFCAVILYEKASQNNNIWPPRFFAALGALLGLEADVLFRIFVLVPLQGYKLFYGLTRETLTLIWTVPAPLITPVKVSISILISAMLVPSIKRIFKENKISRLNL